jgi:polysaccharide export outer membrane protein
MRLCLYLLLAGLVFLSSCIPNKKITLLQKNDVNVKGLPKDSIVRTYAVDSFHYKIQSGDLLHIRFESLTAKEFDILANPVQQPINSGNVATLLIGELVDNNGEIPFPVIGKVKVAGLTVFEIQEKLQGLATEYLQTPLVKVRLINYRVTFLGEVKNEGTMVFDNHRVNMLEAISRMGGLSELADRSNVKLIRQHEGKTEVVYINLLEEEFLKSPYYYVYQNDVIIVPALKQRPFRRYFGENLALVVSSISLILLTINLTK